MAALALVARNVTLWGLVELKMELLIQCVPTFLVALHSKRLRAGPLLVGFALGTAVAVGVGLGLGVSRLGGVHIGVVGLALNLAAAALFSISARSGAPARR